MSPAGRVFPLTGVARTADGLVRADQRTAAEKTCGCGKPAVIAVYIQRVKGRGGARTICTSRIPLCREHNAAHKAQAKRRNAAIAQASLGRDAEIRRARAELRAQLSRPILTFTVVAEIGYPAQEGEDEQ